MGHQKNAKTESAFVIRNSFELKRYSNRISGRFNLTFQMFSYLGKSLNKMNKFRLLIFKYRQIDWFNNYKLTRRVKKKI